METSDQPGPPVVSALARTVWLLTGLAWAFASLIQLAGPRYWDAVTTLDYLAVYSLSLALLLLAIGVVALARIAPRRAVIVTALVVAAAAAATGVANFVEDGIGLKSWGTIFVISSLTTLFGMVPLAILLWKGPNPRLALVPGLTLLGFATFPIGGGLLILAGWGLLAIRPRALVEPR